MKRSVYKVICFLLVMLMLPLVSLTVLTADDSTDLHSLHFDIELWEDGSAYITETSLLRMPGYLW